jgi:hypothetical protein
MRTPLDDWYPYPTSPEFPDVTKRAIYDEEGNLVGVEYQYIDEEGTLWIVRDDYINKERSFHHLPADR